MMISNEKCKEMKCENYMKIEISRQKTIITDPQRRVYNGCMYSSKQIFEPFETLESRIPKNEIEERVAFWIDLNNYAVSQRGKSSRNKYRIAKDK